MVFAARRNALLVNPLGPPKTFFCSTTATFLPSLLAVRAVVSPPIPMMNEYIHEQVKKSSVRENRVNGKHN